MTSQKSYLLQQQQPTLKVKQQHFLENHYQEQPSTNLLYGKQHFPIDDFHLLDNPNKYSEEEKQLRIKLTAIYRLIELNGWSMGIYNHVTAKLNSDELIIHPFGLHYNEITASSILKVSTKNGRIVDRGSTNFELNWPGYIIHSAVHMARPDLHCIIHLHYSPVSAASALKYGLLPVCQEQALLGEIKYFDYTGILTEEDERDQVAQAFSGPSKVMLLRNHGLIVGGETVEEAFYLLANLMKACETQSKLIATVGLDNLILITPEAAQQAWQTVQNSKYPIRQFFRLQHSITNDSYVSTSNLSDSTSGNESDESDSSRHNNNMITNLKDRDLNKVQSRVVGHVNMFELDFEAQMRNLDLLGHETGYKYKRPLIRFYKQR